MNAGYAIGADVVMRTLCKQRDAILDPTSLVFPTIRISLSSQSLRIPSFFFSVTWLGLNTYFSLQEDDLNAGKLPCSFSVSIFKSLTLQSR